MPTEREVYNFIAKRSKAAIVLEMLLDREYVTCSDIIKCGCEGTPLVFTTCPHSLIREIRNEFGAGFVKDRDVKFYRNNYKGNGATQKVSDTYKQYFLDKMSITEVA